VVPRDGVPGALRSLGFEQRPDGTFAFEEVVAERKTFLSRQKLIHRVSVRVDDARREVRFFELLRESSRGLVGGLDLKVEVTGVKGKERAGTIEEHSRYLGHRYDYRVDYAAIRASVEDAACAAGYAFELVLLERSL
jgi:hypothetical protein